MLFSFAILHDEEGGTREEQKEETGERRKKEKVFKATDERTTVQRGAEIHREGQEQKGAERKVKDGQR